MNLNIIVQCSACGWKGNQKELVEVKDGKQCPDCLQYFTSMFKIHEYKPEITIKEITERFARSYDFEKAARDLMKENYYYVLGGKPKPPTRWQRFKYRLQDLKQRAKDIWTILRGRDIHENCGW